MTKQNQTQSFDLVRFSSIQFNFFHFFFQCVTPGISNIKYSYWIRIEIVSRGALHDNPKTSSISIFLSISWLQFSISLAHTKPCPKLCQFLHVVACLKLSRPIITACCCCYCLAAFESCTKANESHNSYCWHCCALIDYDEENVKGFENICSSPELKLVEKHWRKMFCRI